MEVEGKNGGKEMEGKESKRMKRTKDESWERKRRMTERKRKVKEGKDTRR